ncbi:MAG: SUMF1/EgtB/PvdO family nonheme iron enzyme [Kiritimatiellia bacterium]
MKKTKAGRILLAGLASCLALSALADGPTIKDVVVRQRWPWSRRVNIDYVLSDAPEKSPDIAVKMFNGTNSNALTIPVNSLCGDLYCVSNGVKRIVWDPTKTSYTNEQLTRFRVDITPVPAPLYLILDLTASAGASNQIEYVYEADLITNKWGSWERDFIQTNGVAIVESVIWTDVTNNPAFKKDKLVLRRIPAGRFGMGSNLVETTAGEDFYAGVFEVTEAQWAMVITGNSVINGKPKVRISYDDVRGATTNLPTVDWPMTGSLVSPESFMGQLRAKTGVGGFDLPSEVQWEYLCRAGTITDFNDGFAVASSNSLNQLGWWFENCIALHPVGEKRPNAWGLYDTHGNAHEFCLDLYNSLPGKRLVRGGSYSSPNLEYCSSYYSNYGLSDTGYSNRGLRLIWNLQ